MRLYYLIVLFSINLNVAFSQSNYDYTLAKEYYINGEFEKAAHIFEKVFKKTKTKDLYSKYLDCLIKTQSYKKAEKTIKAYNTKKRSSTLHLDLGHLYLIMGNLDDANNQFELSIEAASKSDRELASVATQFYKKNLLDYALKSYLLCKNQTNYLFQIANIYSQLGDIENMYSKLISLLSIRPKYFQTIKNKIRRSISDDSENENNKRLKKIILKNIQKNSSFEISKLYVWLLIQEKNLSDALKHEMSIDKRYGNNTDGISYVGDIAKSNKNYPVALDCFEYILNKKNVSVYDYEYSLINKLNIQFLILFNKIGATKKEIEDTAKELKNTINEIGTKPETISVIKNYSTILFELLNKTDEAISLMQKTILDPSLSNYDVAICKMELAKMLVNTGLMWDASLIYSQVEKEFKNDIIGQEAKFEKIKINYYNGEFEWAQSQLNILKESTSKLIANNAMELALLISDNLNLDTSDEALSIYANAELLYRQRKHSDAMNALDSLEKKFPNHSLSDEILFKKANISMANKNYPNALIYLNKIETDFYYDILYDDALYKQGLIYEEVLLDHDIALKKYEKLLLMAPNSIYLSFARQKYRDLRKNNFLIQQ